MTSIKESLPTVTTLMSERVAQEDSRFSSFTCESSGARQAPSLERIGATNQEDFL